MIRQNILEAICYKNFELTILNQVELPQDVSYEDCSSCMQAYHAIKEMKVRGAPAIAIVAALSLACELQKESFSSVAAVQYFVSEKLDFLCTSRPTAVNLFQMAREMKALSLATTEQTPQGLVTQLCTFAEGFYRQDVENNKLIGQHGADYLMKKIAKPLRILTHCNTGSLATAGYGTALGVIRSLFAQQSLEHVYATETRPYCQGARLTAYELVYEKIPATLIVDSAVSFLMAQGLIDAVIVGADRIAENGDTANKIGTYQIALAAAYHKIPFYVAAPTTSCDVMLSCGEEIPVEERASREITHLQGKQIAADGIAVWNPSFDITPAACIEAIFTQRGVIQKNSAGLFSLKDILHE